MFSTWSGPPKIISMGKENMPWEPKKAIPEKVQIIKDEIKKLAQKANIEIKGSTTPNMPAPLPPPLPPPPPPSQLVSMEPKVKIKTVNGLQHVEIRVKKSNKDSLMDELKNKLRKRQNMQDFQIRKEWHQDLYFVDHNDYLWLVLWG